MIRIILIFILFISCSSNSSNEEQEINNTIKPENNIKQENKKTLIIYSDSGDYSISPHLNKIQGQIKNQNLPLGKFSISTIHEDQIHFNLNSILPHLPNQSTDTIIEFSNPNHNLSLINQLVILPSTPNHQGYLHPCYRCPKRMTEVYLNLELEWKALKEKYHVN